MRIRLAGLTLGLIGAALAAPVVQANFHLMKVVGLFPGAPAAPTAQYVVLQMYFANQNFVQFHHVTFYNAAGAQVLDYPIPNNVAGFADQSKILFATAAAGTFFNVTPDFTLPGTPIDPVGGKVCFDAIPIDCLAWGNYHGDATGVGTPFHWPMGLDLGSAVRRRLDVAGGPTTLEAADDTDNCASDFVAAAPAPVNNANAAGAIPASLCGNAAVEGVEQCDDGNTGGDDSCSPTCTLERISADGFETGDLSRWAVQTTNVGALSVSGANPIAGAFTAEGDIHDTNSLYVENATVTGEVRYRARFRIDPSSFDPGEGLNHHRVRVLLGLASSPSRRLFAVVLRRQGGQQAIAARARMDDNSQVDTPFVNLDPGPHAVEIDWKASSSSSASDGQLRLWVDGVLQSTMPALNNNVSILKAVRLGALNVKAGASGLLRWDDFDARRSVYVGP
jgi:cysteine-rich repeat protein